MARQGVFAEYVLKDTPTDSDVASVLDTLAQILRQQMRRRGVWNLPPSRWEYAGKAWRDKETFNDLLFDCFAYVFDGQKGKRLTKLREYARQQRSIDGAVRRAVYFFLNVQEKRKDPAGHDVFKNVQAAVAEALTEGRLTSEHTTIGKITNETVVAPPPQSETTRISHRELRAAVTGWSDGPALCRRMAKKSRPGLRAAMEVISRLAAIHSRAWRVGDLVEAVKQALPSRTSEDFQVVTSSVPASDSGPASALETEDTVQVKSERTKAAIEGLPYQRKVKERMLQLWDWTIGYYRQNGRFPKQSEAVASLDLPRQRVSEDYGRLRELLCEIWKVDPDK
jgi:hypothetical protein